MTPHILIVEDDARLASVLTKGLGESGFTTTHSPDAEAALTLLHSHPFDLALIDVMLPKMNGIDLCKKVKSLYPALPVVMLTALGETDNIEFDTGTNYIDVYINYLRKKVDKPFATKLIHTKTGTGFYLKAE